MQCAFALAPVWGQYRDFGTNLGSRLHMDTIWCQCPLRLWIDQYLIFISIFYSFIFYFDFMPCLLVDELRSLIFLLLAHLSSPLPSAFTAKHRKKVCFLSNYQLKETRLNPKQWIHGKRLLNSPCVVPND